MNSFLIEIMHANCKLIDELLIYVLISIYQLSYSICGYRLLSEIREQESDLIVFVENNLIIRNFSLFQVYPIQQSDLIGFVENNLNIRNLSIFHSLTYSTKCMSGFIRTVHELGL